MEAAAIEKKIVSNQMRYIYRGLTVNPAAPPTVWNYLQVKFKTVFHLSFLA